MHQLLECDLLGPCSRLCLGELFPPWWWLSPSLQSVSAPLGVTESPVVQGHVGFAVWSVSQMTCSGESAPCRGSSQGAAERYWLFMNDEGVFCSPALFGVVTVPGLHHHHSLKLALGSGAAALLLAALLQHGRLHRRAGGRRCRHTCLAWGEIGHAGVAGRQLEALPSGTGSSRAALPYKRVWTAVVVGG